MSGREREVGSAEEKPPIESALASSPRGETVSLRKAGEKEREEGNKRGPKLWRREAFLFFSLSFFLSFFQPFIFLILLSFSFFLSLL